MKTLIAAILNAAWLAGGGWWLRGLHDNRKRRKAKPYTYRWECQTCDDWFTMQGDNPAVLAALIERVNAKHVCGVPIL